MSEWCAFTDGDRHCVLTRHEGAHALDWRHAYVWLSPGRHSGDPCIGGTGHGTRFIAGMWWAGHRDLPDILTDYTLTRPQLLIACWYMSRYGGRTWRRRWGAWAEEQRWALWHARYDDVPLPSQQPTRAAGAREVGE